MISGDDDAAARLSPAVRARIELVRSSLGSMSLQQRSRGHARAIARFVKPRRVASLWAITSLAKNDRMKDLAGEYINYMVSKEASVTWVHAGYLPATPVPEDAAVKASPLLKEGISMWKSLNDNNALGHYPDWASPTMLKTFDENTPLLLAGKQTPEELIGKLDTDYAAYMKGK